MKKSKADLKNLSDEELCTLYINNITNSSSLANIAFGILYNRHFVCIQNFILNKCKDKDLAMDIAQETFIKLHSALLENNLRNLVNIKNWLYMVSKNQFIDFCRKQTRAPVDNYDNEQFDIFPSTFSSELESKELMNIIKQSIEMLPYNQKRTILERTEEELSFKKIAEMYDESINSALARARYARIRLARILLNHIEFSGMLHHVK